MRLRTFILMTGIVLMVSVGVALCGCTSGPGVTTPTPAPGPAYANYSSYTDKETGVSFTYPNTWNVTEDFLGATVVFVKGDGSSVNLGIQKGVPSNVTLKDVVDVGTAQLGLLLKNASIGTPEHTTFNGCDAYNLTYEGRFNEEDFNWAQTVFRKGDMLYTLTFTSFKKNYDADIAEGRNIINSFKFV